MHILTASDENYVMGVLCLIASAARHNPEARFTVLTTEWSQPSQAKLRHLGQRLAIDIQTIEISSERLAGFAITRRHLTASTFARLFIPDLLSEEDRVIYMDCDMLVTGALDEAWGCNLDGYVLAAVRCPAPTPSFADAIKLPIEQYFSAGFLVLNLGVWRAEKLAERCFAALSAEDCPYLSQDESALNDIARNRVRYLHPGLNLYALDRIWQSPLAAPQSIRVIHYITRPKPWSGNCPFGVLWLREAARLPECQGFRPARESFSVRMSRLNRLRKAYMGRLLGKSRYLRHQDAYRAIHRVLVPGFIVRGHF